ncbi:hypothetical protein BU14_0237s0017 [Porphyra umbilicalis]|uniref:Uncharacterized protein n=1 Tax=Porphyra umbilicalis TaxID=2786 RepID=A0A1X6P3V0_PORUM|nr:hypothetical protein BU14_0237s0017 [Porphyra umbilicalis]|eukprot:OSX75425.1 hypothetical protein BU14_0237s0017 [Porphyra umbilicalis]
MTGMPTLHTATAAMVARASEAAYQSCRKPPGHYHGRHRHRGSHVLDGALPGSLEKPPGIPIRQIYGAPPSLGEHPRSAERPSRHADEQPSTASAMPPPSRRRAAPRRGGARSSPKPRLAVMCARTPQWHTRWEEGAPRIRPNHLPAPPTRPSHARTGRSARLAAAAPTTVVGWPRLPGVC